MSVLPSSPSTALSDPGPASYSDTAAAGGVVEFGLLLPAEWAVTLIELSKKRQQSVGQMLRSAIERTFIHAELSN